MNRVTRILNGRRAVTGDTALRLGRFFGTSGEFWLNLQKLYELRLAARENGAAIARLPTLDAARDLRVAASSWVRVSTVLGGLRWRLAIRSYSSDSSIRAILIRCFCRPRFRTSAPCTGTEMRAGTPVFA